MEIEKNIEFNELEISQILNGEKQAIFDSNSENFNNLIPLILERGPNYGQFIRSSTDKLDVSTFSLVLSLRAPFTKQPLISDNFVILFNGELYNDEINGNDGEFILQNLLSSSDRPVEDVIRMVDGEFALVIWDKLENLIYFCRDNVGKRSLTFKYDPKNPHDFIISSLQPTLIEERDHFKDCLNGVIYKYN